MWRVRLTTHLTVLWSNCPLQGWQVSGQILGLWHQIIFFQLRDVMCLGCLTFCSSKWHQADREVSPIRLVGTKTHLLHGTAADVDWPPWKKKEKTLVCFKNSVCQPKASDNPMWLEINKNRSNVMWRSKRSFQTNLREAIVDQLPTFSPSSILLNFPNPLPKPSETLRVLEYC